MKKGLINVKKALNEIKDTIEENSDSVYNAMRSAVLRQVPVEIKKLDKNAIVPKYAHDSDACFDLHALEGGRIMPGEHALVKTGLAYGLPEAYEIQVRPRSGHAYKKGITVLNSPGTIDPDYTGDLGVILVNHGHEPFLYEAGDRIAQAAVKPVYHAEFTLVDELHSTVRGAGGFGHTGTKKKD